MLQYWFYVLSSLLDAVFSSVNNAFGNRSWQYNICKNRRNYGNSLVNIFPLGESSQEPCDFSRGRFRSVTKKRLEKEWIKCAIIIDHIIDIHYCDKNASKKSKYGSERTIL